MSLKIWLLVFGAAGIVGCVAGIAVDGGFAGALSGFPIGVILAVIAYFTF